MATDSDTGMDIKDAAAASGLTADTIRFYERRGVLPPPPRQPNGYRRYTETHLAVLRLAAGLRDLALPLDAVRDIVAVAHDGTCRDVRDRLHHTLTAALAEADAQLAALRATRARLREVERAVAASPPGAASVAGLTPCACVRAVASRRRVAGTRRR